MLSIGSKVAQGLGRCTANYVAILELKMYMCTHTQAHTRTHMSTAAATAEHEMNNNLRAESEIKIPNTLGELAVTKAQQSETT